MPILTLALAMVLFYFLHSALAASFVKQKLATVVSSRYYRLFYNAIAIGTSLLILWLFLRIDSPFLFSKTTLLSIFGGILLLCGAIIGIISLRQYDLREFIGLPYYKPSTSLVKGELQVKGINAQIRHPLYLATLLLFWGAFLLLPQLSVFLLAVITTIYTFIGIHFEEKKLFDEFGDDYRQYQNKVPMLFPFFR